jgi:hypothetical protein
MWPRQLSSPAALVMTAGRTHHHANRDVLLAGAPLPIRLQRSNVRAAAVVALVVGVQVDDLLSRRSEARITRA